MQRSRKLNEQWSGGLLVYFSCETLPHSCQWAQFTAFFFWSVKPCQGIVLWAASITEEGISTSQIVLFEWFMVVQHRFMHFPSSYNSAWLRGFKLLGCCGGFQGLSWIFALIYQQGSKCASTLRLSSWDKLPGITSQMGRRWQTNEKEQQKLILNFLRIEAGVWFWATGSLSWWMV